MKFIWNDSWLFTKDTALVSDSHTALNLSEWVTVTLPHTWNAIDGQDGGNDYYRGTCYYYKKLFLDDCKNAEDIENVLKKQGKDFIVGTQNGTTGFMYSAGDADFGYDGFKNLETKSYTTGSLAVLDLANGKIDAVIIDKQPAIMIAKSTNE